MPSGGLPAFEHAPLMLGVTHLLITIACVLLSLRSAASAAARQSADSRSAGHRARRVAAALHAEARTVRVRVAHRGPRALRLCRAASACFGPGSARRSPTIAFVTPIAAAPIAMCAGIAIGTIVSISSPPLALVNAVVSALAAIDLAGIRRSSLAASRSCRWHCSPTASPARASFIATGRKRLGLEAQARKAQHFVDEFENSGRGWFWETDSLGTLSYVSRQLADDFQCEPEALLGRQFTDLLSVDHASRIDRGAQDAGLPSVGALPLLRRGRPPGERGGRPLVAVGQPDLRRARALPRLSRHRHRPHRAAQVGARDLAPGPLRFADRPAEPRDDAPDARRGAAQRGPPAEGLRACS